MRIERITEILPILDLIPFEQEIRNKGRDNTRISKMVLLIKEMLPSELFGVWIAYDDKIVGYTIAMLALIPGMERLSLWRMYAKDKGLREEFESILRTWAKEYKVKIASTIAYTEGSAKALERHSGWKQVSTNLERRI